MNAVSIQEIVTEGELDAVWGSANFGSMTKREVIKDSLLKCLGGYHTGHTAKCIVVELKLVYANKWELTKKGKEYLYLSLASPVGLEKWKEQARLYAELMMYKGENNEGWDRNDDLNIGIFYNYMLMFIADTYDLFEKKDINPNAGSTPDR